MISKEFLGSLLIAMALHKNIEHFPILIYRSPRIKYLSIYSDEYLIEMPYLH
jgi:hypothetical protein